MNTALVLIDIQNDYFPEGEMELEGALEASLQARALLSRFRGARLPLIHIQHLAARPGATFLVPGTAGAEIHRSVSPLSGEILFSKHYPNGFRETPLLAHLRNTRIERLVLCGMMTHMCVDSTVRAAFDHGFDCLVAGDACATRALTATGEVVPARHVHMAFLAALDGMFAKVLTAQDIMLRL